MAKDLISYRMFVEKFVIFCLMFHSIICLLIVCLDVFLVFFKGKLNARKKVYILGKWNYVKKAFFSPRSKLKNTPSSKRFRKPLIVSGSKYRQSQSITKLFFFNNVCVNQSQALSSVAYLRTFS